MSASLSSALSAMLSNGEEANDNERNEKLEAAALNVSKLLASVKSGKADPSVLDGLINGDFGSGSSASASSSALPPAPASSSAPAWCAGCSTRTTPLTFSRSSFGVVEIRVSAVQCKPLPTKHPATRLTLAPVSSRQSRSATT